MRKYIEILILGIIMLVACNNADTKSQNDSVSEKSASVETNAPEPTASSEDLKKYIDYFLIDKNFVINKDKFQETIFAYSSKIAEKKSDNIIFNGTLYSYISINDKTADVSLHLVGRHSGKDWVFFNKAQLDGDDGVFTIFDNISSSDKTEKVLDSGSVVEKYDMSPVSESIINNIKKLGATKTYIIRFTGKDSYIEYSVKPEEIQALQETINVYQELKEISKTKRLPNDYNKVESAAEKNLNIQIVLEF